MTIKSRYAKKVVDSKFYGVVKITGDSEPKRLTRKEFNEGKQGLVYLDSKTGKIVFND